MEMSFFELPPMLPATHMPLQMQGMDRKYDGHVWCKVITTKIKKKFGFSFKKAHCLGRSRYVQDDYENVVHAGSHNEIF
jgi:hypothetical protein